MAIGHDRRTGASRAALAGSLCLAAVLAVVALVGEIGTARADLIFQNTDCWSCHGDEFHRSYGLEYIDCDMCHEAHDYWGVNQFSDIGEGDHDWDGYDDCMWCHNSAWSVPQHTAESLDGVHLTTVGFDAECAPCHDANLMTEHPDACAACHSSIDPDVQAAVADWDRSCGACHADADAAHVSLHDGGLTQSSCLGCHDSNTSTEHADNCALCHESADPVVIAAIDARDLSCGACHSDIHSGSHESGIAGSRCAGCHAVNIVLEPGHTSCDACHASVDPLVVAALADWDGSCTSCHPDYHGTPHGGYSMTTDVCLQCHDIHQAAGDYVLMREETVTQVCATCHTLYQSEPTGAYDPGYPGVSASEMPELAAYKVPLGQAATHGGHRLGMGTDDIPGGTQGLTAIQYLAYPGTVPATSFSATDGLYCASCHTPHGEFGNLMPSSFSTKLLSSTPNHIETDLSLVLTDWLEDGGQWCGACHDRRLPGAEHYNHPDTGCLVCHGDSIEDPTDDFPHTSNDDNLLTVLPDEICLQCHVSGLLP